MTCSRATGEYPTSIEELIPDFMKENKTCHLGGDYSLDMSSDHPQARCSIHGTTDSYSEQPDIDKRHKYDWYYSS